MFRLFLVVSIVVSFMTACSNNIRPYKTAVANNLFLQSRTDSDVTAELDIYHVGSNCTLDYLGTVNLQDVKKTGLLVNRLTSLVIRFTTSSFWSSSSSSMSQEVLLKPNKGSRYYLDTSYVDNIYNVEIKVAPQGDKKRRLVESLDWNVCKG